jgi:hypothetical protein
MAIYIGKYAFNSKEQAINKIEALGTITDEDGNTHPNHKHTVVELGLEVVSEPVFDGEDVLEEEVLGTDYLVDVIWHDLEIEEDGSVDHPYGWKSYSIDIDSEGIHKFLGLNYQDLKI